MREIQETGSGDDADSSQSILRAVHAATCALPFGITPLEESTHCISCFPTSISSNAYNVRDITNSHAEEGSSYNDFMSDFVEPSTEIPFLEGRTQDQFFKLSSETSQGRSPSYQAAPYITIAAGIIAMIALYKKYRAKASNQALQPQAKKDHLGVIKFTPIGEAELKGQKEKQLSRARPNQRLTIVFGIDNAFTTTNLRVHARFLTAAKQKMQDAISLDRTNPSGRDGDWTEMREVVRVAVTQMLEHGQDKFRLVDLVRVVTLKVSLRFLFHVSEEAINSRQSIDHLILIGQRINDLWIASKDTKNPLPVWTSDANTALHDALRTVCASEDPAQAAIIDPLTPELNPMNWLLPAYETMWRVVLSCVLELYFRKDAKNAPLWREVLQQYIADPSREAFNGACITPGVRPLSANDIVKETLRLYPPTRRVYRRFSETGSDVVADIESCHRNTAIDGFGRDALSFRPERWAEMRAELGEGTSDSHVKTTEEERGFMPFAVFCPAGKGATQGFGLKMIALLAGVVGEGLEREGEWRLEGGDGEWGLMRPLPSDRAAFDGVYLVRRRI